MDPEQLGASGRVLLLAAHPDDETIGAGAQLPRWQHRVLIVHATDGAPRNFGDFERAGCSTREDYALLRRNELACAVGVAGISPSQCIGLPIVDQETMHHLESVTREIARVIDDFRPDVLLTHPYEGGHPDHDSCSFAARFACLLSTWRLRLMEFTSYHAGPSGMMAGDFLGAAGPVRTYVLSDAEREMKREMFACHASQQHVLHYFGVERERFRPAPEYDFAAPPHSGRLHYESLGWGIEGANWRDHAQRAMKELGIQHATHDS